MTVEEIFSKLCAHMATGVKFHNEVANAYSFLSLSCYQHDHEEHFIEESKNYRDLQSFYLDQYHKLIPPSSSETIEAIPSTWYKYKREDVDSGEIFEPTTVKMKIDLHYFQNKHYFD